MDETNALNIKGKPYQIKITFIDSLKNEFQWIVTKNKKGHYKIDTLAQHYSNWQINSFSLNDIEWKMDSENWDEVYLMICEGVRRIKKVEYR